MTRRRDFLAFTASAVTAGTVLPAAGKSAPIDVVSQEPAVAGELLPSAGKYPDAELIGWCAAILAMEAEWRARPLDAGDTADEPTAYYPTIDVVNATPALTEEGNRAKLAVALEFYEPDLPAESIVDPMLWDAVRALALPPTVAPVAVVDPDAALIAICAELEGLTREAKVLGESRPIKTPERLAAINVNCSRWDILAHQASTMPAATLTGVRAKAAAVQQYLEEFGFDAAYSSDEGEDFLLRSLARDLFGSDYVYVGGGHA